MELEEKQLKQLTQMQYFRDFINRLYQQELHKRIKINLEQDEISTQYIMQELNLNKHTSASNLVDIYKQNVANQINSLFQEEKIDELEKMSEQEKNILEKKNEEVENLDTSVEL